MKRALHQFLKWAPAALCGGILAIVVGVPSTYPETKPWFVHQWTAIRDWCTANSTAALILAALLLLVWLVLYVFTADEEKPPYADLVELLRQPPPSPSRSAHVVAPLPPATSIAGTSIQPDSAVSASQASSPTITAHPPLQNELYVGIVIVSAGRLEDDGYLEVAIRAFNGTGRSIRVAKVEGVISGAIGDGSSRDLPPVEWQAHFNDNDVPPGGEFMVVVHQPVHPEDVRDYLQALDDDYATLDLRQLDIRVQEVGEPERTARLPVWDGVNLRRRNDVFTGRIFMLTITDAVNVQASL